MTEAEQLFRKHNAMLEGHFVHTTWLHCGFYFNKDALYMRPNVISRLAGWIAEGFDDDIEVVIAPATGGCILANRVAEHLQPHTSSDVLATYADKRVGGFVIKRTYDLVIPGKSVLVLDDVVHTGSSTRELVKEVRKLKGEVVGVGSLYSYGIATAENLDVPQFKSLLTLPQIDYKEEECPLCKKGVPVEESLGKGKEFLESRQRKLFD